MLAVDSRSGIRSRSRGLSNLSAYPRLAPAAIRCSGLRASHLRCAMAFVGNGCEPAVLTALRQMRYLRKHAYLRVGQCPADRASSVRVIAALARSRVRQTGRHQRAPHLAPRLTRLVLDGTSALRASPDEVSFRCANCATFGAATAPQPLTRSAAADEVSFSVGELPNRAPRSLTGRLGAWRAPPEPDEVSFWCASCAAAGEERLWDVAERPRSRTDG